jgi:hypothetical protein
METQEGIAVVRYPAILRAGQYSTKCFYKERVGKGENKQ